MSHRGEGVRRGQEHDLFQLGAFRLHSGEPALFKIECNNLEEAEVFALAALLKDVLPRYGGVVEGVPRGGLRLAQVMQAWSWEDNYPTLICDDVLTTGASIEAHRAGRECIGAVIFARGPVPAWVTALFTMTTRRTVNGKREE